MSLESKLLEVTKNPTVQKVGTGIEILSGVFGVAAPVTAAEVLAANRPSPQSHTIESQQAVQFGQPVKIGENAYALSPVSSSGNSEVQKTLPPVERLTIEKHEFIIDGSGNNTSPLVNSEYAVYTQITEQGENGQTTTSKAKKLNTPYAKPFVVSSGGVTNRLEGISKNNIVVISEGKGLYTTGITAIDLNTGKKEIISDGNGTYIQEQASISDDGRYVSYVTYITGQAQIEVYDRINKTKILTISNPDSSPQNWDGLGQSFFYKGYFVYQQIINGKWGYIARNLKGEEVKRFVVPGRHLVMAEPDEENNRVAFIVSNLTGPESVTSAAILDTETWKLQEYTPDKNKRINYVKPVGQNGLIVNEVDKITNEGAIFYVDQVTNKKYPLTKDNQAFTPSVYTVYEDPNNHSKYTVAYTNRIDTQNAQIKGIDVSISQNNTDSETQPKITSEELIFSDNPIDGALVAGQNGEFVVLSELVKAKNSASYERHISLRNLKTGKNIKLTTDEDSYLGNTSQSGRYFTYEVNRVVHFYDTVEGKDKVVNEGEPRASTRKKPSITEINGEPAIAYISYEINNKAKRFVYTPSIGKAFIALPDGEDEFSIDPVISENVIALNNRGQIIGFFEFTGINPVRPSYENGPRAVVSTKKIGEVSEPNLWLDNVSISQKGDIAVYKGYTPIAGQSATELFVAFGDTKTEKKVDTGVKSTKTSPLLDGNRLFFSDNRDGKYTARMVQDVRMKQTSTELTYNSKALEGFVKSAKLARELSNDDQDVYTVLVSDLKYLNMLHKFTISVPRKVYSIQHNN